MAQDPGQQHEYAKNYGRLVAKAWSDPAFKLRLMADPRAVLKEEGIEVPAGADVRVVENTDQVVYLTLPRQPTDELSDEEVARARPMLCFWSVCCSTDSSW